MLFFLADLTLPPAWPAAEEGGFWGHLYSILLGNGDDGNLGLARQAVEQHLVTSGGARLVHVALSKQRISLQGF